jgi:endonuclease G, mitochondrial
MPIASSNQFARLLLLVCALAVAGPASAKRAPPAVDARGQSEVQGLYGAEQSRPGFASCAALFPRQIPLALEAVPSTWHPIALCSNSFAVLYSGLTKTPLVVVERLNKAQLTDALDEVRTNQFFADPRLPKALRAELDDYRGQGLDRGHMSPAANQPTALAMAQSFALSNMVPQDPTNNRKIWAKLEGDVRKYARRAPGNVFVFSGPLFRDGYRTVGPNKVWVPTHLFKLVYDEAGQRAWAYVLPNADDARITAPMDYLSFVAATGLQLLPGQPVTGSIAGR